jgi:hypothetical protein
MKVPKYTVTQPYFRQLLHDGLYLDTSVLSSDLQILEIQTFYIMGLYIYSVIFPDRATVQCITKLYIQ